MSEDIIQEQAEPVAFGRTVRERFERRVEMNVPDRHNPKLRTLIERVNRDDDLYALWLAANVNAIERLGGRLVRRGVPAHPGSMLWLARVGTVPIVGMPTCGLFAQATVFDLVIARLLTGERLQRRDLGRLAQGGFLTRDMAFRLPAYRAATDRGAVE